MSPISLRLDTDWLPFKVRSATTPSFGAPTTVHPAPSDPFRSPTAEHPPRSAPLPSLPTFSTIGPAAPKVVASPLEFDPLDNAHRFPFHLSISLSELKPP